MHRLAAPLTALAVTLALAAPTLACGGLIGPNGAVNLLRTTTLAGYHDGVEHYVTAFEFAGGSGSFGSIIPLPGIPTSVVRGGDWTLQRLVRETDPQPIFAEAAGDALAARAVVLQQVRIDALDITILKGGGAAIGVWAKEHGFSLPPDSPEVLDFYANRSPIFMAASFDADAAAARGQAIGDGTPVHLTIPTDNPWVPLRILALGKTAAETVQADVYLLTDDRPALLPAPGSRLAKGGLRLAHSGAASEQLLADLRADKGMGWVPQRAWLTKVEIDAAAANLRFDLAIDASGAGKPSLRDAGFAPFGPLPAPPAWNPLWVMLLAIVLAVPLGGGWLLAATTRNGRGGPLAG
jgi:uncharacterized protein DUF2330